MRKSLPNKDAGYALVMQDVRKLIDIMAENKSVREIEPGMIADMVIRLWENGNSIDIRIRWSAVQEIKELARDVLRKYEPSDPESEAYQGTLDFKDLQAWYPLPGGNGVYHRLEDLTQDEMAWNVDRLRNHAKACMKHANKLEKYAASRA